MISSKKWMICKIDIPSEINSPEKQKKCDELQHEILSQLVICSTLGITLKKMKRSAVAGFLRKTENYKNIFSTKLVRKYIFKCKIVTTDLCDFVTKDPLK